MKKRLRISDLHDNILVHIMEFIDTKHAIQTCAISKQWKSLWKSLTSLSFESPLFRTFADFNKFVSKVLSNRDDRTSLVKLEFVLGRFCEQRLLNRVLEYAVLHNLQHLTVTISSMEIFDLELPSSIYLCRSLKFLRLASVHQYNCIVKFPGSLQLPVLKCLYLENVCFTAGDNGFVEPFSTCNLLKSLALIDCCFHDGGVFCISSSNLSNLHIHHSHKERHKYAICTPNLRFLNLSGFHRFYCYHRFSSMSNLPLLEEVNIDGKSPPIFSWLQLFGNVKKMTLSSSTIKRALLVLSIPTILKSQPPCFARLESLKMKMGASRSIPNEGVDMVVQYLLQNSPLITVDVIKC